MRNVVGVFAAVLIGLATVSATGRAQRSAAISLGEAASSQQPSIGGRPFDGDGAEWFKLARLYQNRARYGDAEKAYGKAIALLKSEDPDALVNAEDCMGTLYVEMGKYAEAERLERGALDARERTKDPVGIGISRMHLSMLALGKRDLFSAAADAQLAVGLLVPEGAATAGVRDEATPEEQMTALIDLFLVRCAQGACADALSHLRRALEIANRNYAVHSIPVGFIHFLIGYADWKSGDKTSAAELMSSGISEMEAQLGWGHPTYISALTQYAELLKQNGRDAEAAELRKKIERLDLTRQTSGAGAEAKNQVSDR